MSRVLLAAAPELDEHWPFVAGRLQERLPGLQRVEFAERPLDTVDWTGVRGRAAFSTGRRRSPPTTRRS